jgi:hypothetical protein
LSRERGAYGQQIEWKQNIDHRLAENLRKKVAVGMVGAEFGIGRSKRRLGVVKCAAPALSRKLCPPP